MSYIMNNKAIEVLPKASSLSYPPPMFKHDSERSEEVILFLIIPFLPCIYSSIFHHIFKNSELEKVLWCFSPALNLV